MDRQRIRELAAAKPAWEHFMFVANPDRTDQNGRCARMDDPSPCSPDSHPRSRRLLSRPDDIPEFFELLQRARDGDEFCIGQLLEKYRNYLLVIANADTESWLREKIGPSDLVQASLIRGYENFSQFQGESEAELTAWLRMILKNDLRKGQRHYFTNRRNVHRERNLDAAAPQRPPVVDPALTPQSHALAEEKARSIQSAMAGLTAGQREIIELRNFHQLGFAEIGQRTGRTEDAARKFWARSIEALKSAIKAAQPGLIDESRDWMAGDE
jgi:RNA polymerase sigma-70 factor (ECF subfamily)